MNKAGERLLNGLIKENPTFVLMLGMCPTLAVTSSAINGLGMGLTTAVVLALSNLIISLLRKVIPSRVRIPAFIVIIASFVTIVQLLLEAYLPSLNDALGVYIPLIVVNCIILGRAEAYAYSNPPMASLFDGIGMGLGFSVALTAIGAVRELLGAGKIFGIDLGLPFEPIGIFVLAPGAFFVLAALTALQNYLKIRGEKKGKDMSKVQSGCNEDCMNCGVDGCSKRFYDTVAETTDEPLAEETVPEEMIAEEVTEEVSVKEPAEEFTGEESEDVAALEEETPKKKPAGKNAGRKTTKKSAEKKTVEKEVETTEETETVETTEVVENAEAVEEATQEVLPKENVQSEPETEETVKEEAKPVRKRSTKKAAPKKAKKEEALEVLDLDEEDKA